jgi:hypothetical protein
MRCQVACRRCSCGSGRGRQKIASGRLHGMLLSALQSYPQIFANKK